MVTVNQIIQQVEQLDEEGFKLLLAYIDKRKKEAWNRAFDEAIDDIRDGLSEAEIAEMVQAMNTEYIEPVDESEWQD